MTKLVDRIWLWGHGGDAFAGSGLGTRFGDHHLDIPEACAAMGVPNACVIRWNGLPAEPFEEYCEKLSSLRSFGWSVLDGDTGSTYGQKVERVLGLARRFPKLDSVWLDGWFTELSERPSLVELAVLRNRLSDLPQRPKLSIVFQSHEFHTNPKVALDICDQVSFWLWHAADIPRVGELYTKCRDLVGPEKPVLLAMTMWDMQANRPLAPGMMEHQLAFARSKLESGELVGAILHCSPLVDCDLESVRLVKSWLRTL